jgi:membrane-associated protein
VRLLCGHAMFDWVLQLIHQLYDVRGLIEWGGLLMLTVIVFTETGLLFGFFLPGDSLLVTAGIFAAAGSLDLFTVLIGSVLPPSAVISSATGSAHHRTEDLQTARIRCSSTNGTPSARSASTSGTAKTIIFARFIPIIRTFAPVVAGVCQMESTSSRSGADQKASRR